MQQTTLSLLLAVVLAQSSGIQQLVLCQTTTSPISTTTATSNHLQDPPDRTQSPISSETKDHGRSEPPLERFTRRLKAVGQPKFVAPIGNVTAILGRDVRLICTVENLGQYQVAWLKEETKTILSIDTNIIITNYRIFLIPDEEERKWVLHIKDVQESDRGFYQCQVNTNPMRSTSGYLEVVVPPTIIESQTSQVAEAVEHSNVSIQCKASGHPRPTIVWRREDGLPFRLNGRFDGSQQQAAGPYSGQEQVIIDENAPPGDNAAAVGSQAIMLPPQPHSELNDVKSDKLSFYDVDRSMAGVYVCTASNGIQSQASKRVPLFIKFGPKTSVQNKYISVSLGDQLEIECFVEGAPKATSYWSKISSGGNDGGSSSNRVDELLPAPIASQWAGQQSSGQGGGGWRRVSTFMRRQPPSDMSPTAAVAADRGQDPPASSGQNDDDDDELDQHLDEPHSIGSLKRVNPAGQAKDKVPYNHNFHPHNRIQLRQVQAADHQRYHRHHSSTSVPMESSLGGGSHFVTVDQAANSNGAGEVEIVAVSSASQRHEDEAAGGRRKGSEQSSSKAYVTVKQTTVNSYTYKLKMTIGRMQLDDYGKYSCIAANPLGTSESHVIVTKATRISEMRRTMAPNNTDPRSVVIENDYQHDASGANYQSSPSGPRLGLANGNRVTYDANYLQAIKSRQNNYNAVGSSKSQQQKLKSRLFTDRNSSKSRGSPETRECITMIVSILIGFAFLTRYCSS